MTREEAKEILEILKQSIPDTSATDFERLIICGALEVAIKSLEIVEEFETAQIITGGRLNGRTYAYKCGLEDGKRKALEQEQYYKDLANSYEKTINKLTKAISEQEPKTEWIPVSKELPEEGEEVLVWYEYFRYGDYNCMWQTYGIGWQYDGHFSVDNGGVKQRVIAWQLLPKPYSGVSE